MSEHRVTLAWRNAAATMEYEQYSRNHEWRFAGGVTVPASAAAAFRGDPALVDPEAAFVAALSSCHMLTFLAIAARKRIVVAAYDDDAVGHLEKVADGKLSVTRVELRPRVTLGPGQTLSPEQLTAMHELSHEECFIARSVRTEVSVTPAIP